MRWMVGVVFAIFVGMILVLGRYSAFQAAPGIVFVLDRITGAAWFCVLHGKCQPIPTAVPTLLSDDDVFGAPKARKAE